MKELIGYFLKHEVKPVIEKVAAKTGKITRETISAERKFRMNRLAVKILENTKDHLGEAIPLGESTLKVERNTEGFKFTITEPRQPAKNESRGARKNLANRTDIIEINGLLDQFGIGIAGYQVKVETKGFYTAEFSSNAADPLENTLTPSDVLRYLIDANTIAKSLNKPPTNT